MKQGGKGRGDRSTFLPAAYGFRQGAGTEQSTIWVSHSTPVTQPQNTRSTFCCLASLAANLPQSRRQAPCSFCCLSISSVSQLKPGSANLTDQSRGLGGFLLCSFILLVCMPSSATEPKVCLLFLIGDVQAETVAATPLSLPLSVSLSPPRD